jgi:hypothetical protein
MYMLERRAFSVAQPVIRLRLLWRHCGERQRRTNPVLLVALDCFAEPVIGLAGGETRWLAMTT